MTRRRFLTILVGSASALTGLARKAVAGHDEAPAERPLFFKLSVDYGGEEMTQEIAVGELDRFEVVTQLAHRRWTVRGTTGRIADGAILVELSVQRFDSAQSNETGITRRDLTLDGTWSGKMGAIGGMMLDQSARRRDVKPPAR